MTPQNITDTFKIGTSVRIRGSGYKRGRIVELRGPLGPKGALVYRVEVRKKPRAFIEVLAEQIEAVENQTKD